MSKKPLEIDVVIGEPPDSVRVAKVVMEEKGDLYVMTLAPDVLAGKYSYHASGFSHRYSELIKGRSGEGRPPGRQLSGMKGFALVFSWGCPSVLEPTAYQPKPDTQKRRTLVAPKAEIGWYCHVWAIEAGRRDLVGRITATDPWPSIPVVATVLAEWSDPWLLVVVSSFASTRPYRVIKYFPPIPGRVPYETIPDAFEGTWLEKPGPKWRPGEAVPEEWFDEAVEHILSAEGTGGKASQVPCVEAAAIPLTRLNCNVPRPLPSTGRH